MNYTIDSITQIMIEANSINVKVGQSLGYLGCIFTL